MLFSSADEFVKAPRRAITVFGMAGVGKTRLSNMLRDNSWFHYSADYRIGTRYMGEFIVDNFKHEAMKVPFLAQLLRSDSIYISSNITFDNLDPLSTYLGTPGDETRGGLPLAEYQRRQEQHRVAEIAALQDVPYFFDRAKALYGYNDFIADTGGSLIEVIDPTNAEDPVVKTLAAHTALIYIRGTDKDAIELVKRFKKSPKPMYYRPEFLVEKWAEYKLINGIMDDCDVDPAGFGAWGFEALLHDRLPRYQALADNFGYVIEASDLATVRDGDEFIDLVAAAIEKRMR
ncbi:ATPase [Devosia sp. MC532]|uniref:ATPase n=1 Tax=unclassified Devosia TaxID=196773 RepID=UPI0018F74B2A|nr:MULTISPECIES: ATPase [unclassified Devosia]MBJ7577100.1 ATPase [Devosia sp. MC532]MBK1793670.1 ATPase [Devosia sp. WQ 349K1]